MRYFGLFSSEKATIRGGNLLDTLCGQLEKLLSFQAGERDLVMLQHKFVVEWEDGHKVSAFSPLVELSELRDDPRTLSPPSFILSSMDPQYQTITATASLKRPLRTVAPKTKSTNKPPFHPQDTITSTLQLLGDPTGYSAMSKSVGVTCGIAAQLLLNGHSALNKPGIIAPYEKDICDPIRELLEREGITMVEKRV